MQTRTRRTRLLLACFAALQPSARLQPTPTFPAAPVPAAPVPAAPVPSPTFPGNFDAVLPPTRPLLPTPGPSTQLLFGVSCSDQDPACNVWAGLGECDSNPVFMRASCIKSCGGCGTTRAPFTAAVYTTTPTTVETAPSRDFSPSSRTAPVGQWVEPRKTSGGTAMQLHRLMAVVLGIAICSSTC